MVRMRMLGLVTMALALLPTGAPAQAVEDAAQTEAEIQAVIAALRKDVRAGKADVLGKSMALDATQAAAFWPIYERYAAELEGLGNERLAILEDLAEQFDTLDDAKAMALVERQLALEDKRLALTRKYKDEMLKSLPAKTVARFLQVESRLNKLVDLAVASQVPLVY